MKENPEHLKLLEQWMRSYRPDELFDERGRLKPEIKAIAPKGNRRMGANPHANGGLLTIALDIPSFTDYAVPLEQPGSVKVESTRPFGKMLRDIFTRNAKQQNFRLFCPDETNSNRLGDVFEVENRCLVSRVESYDDHVSHDGRVMEVLSEHCHQGWLEGYTLTGRHGVFRVVRGVRDDRRLDGDAAREMAADLQDRVAVAAARSRRSTTCSPRPAGATITTASAIRAPALSTRC